MEVYILVSTLNGVVTGAIPFIQVKNLIAKVKILVENKIGLEFKPSEDTLEAAVTEWSSIKTMHHDMHKVRRYDFNMLKTKVEDI